MSTDRAAALPVLNRQPEVPRSSSFTRTSVSHVSSHGTGGFLSAQSLLAASLAPAAAAGPAPLPPPPPTATAPAKKTPISPELEMLMNSCGMGEADARRELLRREAARTGQAYKPEPHRRSRSSRRKAPEVGRNSEKLPAAHAGASESSDAAKQRKAAAAAAAALTASQRAAPPPGAAVEKGHNFEKNVEKNVEQKGGGALADRMAAFQKAAAESSAVSVPAANPARRSVLFSPVVHVRELDGSTPGSTPSATPTGTPTGTPEKRVAPTPVHEKAAPVTPVKMPTVGPVVDDVPVPRTPELRTTPRKKMKDHIPRPPSFTKRGSNPVISPAGTPIRLLDPDTEGEEEFVASGVEANPPSPVPDIYATEGQVLDVGRGEKKTDVVVKEETVDEPKSNGVVAAAPEDDDHPVREGGKEAREMRGSKIKRGMTMFGRRRSSAAAKESLGRLQPVQPPAQEPGSNRADSTADQAKTVDVAVAGAVMKPEDTRIIRGPSNPYRGPAVPAAATSELPKLRSAQQTPVESRAVKVEKPTVEKPVTDSSVSRQTSLPGGSDYQRDDEKDSGVKTDRNKTGLFARLRHTRASRSKSLLKASTHTVASPTTAAVAAGSLTKSTRVDQESEKERELVGGGVEADFLSASMGGTDERSTNPPIAEKRKSANKEKNAANQAESEATGDSAFARSLEPAGSASGSPGVVSISTPKSDVDEISVAIASAKKKEAREEEDVVKMMKAAEGEKAAASAARAKAKEEKVAATRKRAAQKSADAQKKNEEKAAALEKKADAGAALNRDMEGASTETVADAEAAGKVEAVKAAKAAEEEEDAAAAVEVLKKRRADSVAARKLESKAASKAEKKLEDDRRATAAFVATSEGHTSSAIGGSEVVDEEDVSDVNSGADADLPTVLVKRVVRRKAIDGTEELVTKRVRVRPVRVFDNGDVIVRRKVLQPVAGSTTGEIETVYVERLIKKKKVGDPLPGGEGKKKAVEKIETKSPDRARVTSPSSKIGSAVAGAAALVGVAAGGAATAAVATSAATDDSASDAYNTPPGSDGERQVVAEKNATRAALIASKIAAAKGEHMVTPSKLPVNVVSAEQVTPSRLPDKPDQFQLSAHSPTTPGAVSVDIMGAVSSRSPGESDMSLPAASPDSSENVTRRRSFGVYQPIEHSSAAPVHIPMRLAQLGGVTIDSDQPTDKSQFVTNKEEFAVIAPVEVVVQPDQYEVKHNGNLPASDGGLDSQQTASASIGSSSGRKKFRANVPRNKTDVPRNKTFSSFLSSRRSSVVEHSSVADPDSSSSKVSPKAPNTASKSTAYPASQSHIPSMRIPRSRSVHTEMRRAEKDSQPTLGDSQHETMPNLGLSDISNAATPNTSTERPRPGRTIKNLFVRARSRILNKSTAAAS